KKKILPEDKNVLKTTIKYFLDYYIAHEAQWRMITHFALHGNKDMGSVEKLNEIGRRLMDVFETIFIYLGCRKETRLMSHTLFSCLSGVLIAFRNYPGRSEEERIIHMEKIGSVIESMIIALIKK
ncbi:MAG: TetR/AcrR family transcriptional regulator, partial [Desulfobacula sp.]|nr:TetR/AcrR family transcriptional regulator [Desulfobacula sp.]